MGGAVLAGGRSTRMGQDKASMLRGSEFGHLPGGGETWLERQLALLSGCGIGHRLVSCRADRPSPRLPPDIVLVRDRFPNCGPMAGLEAVLSHLEATSVVVLAIDLQRMTPEFLTELITQTAPAVGVIPMVDGRFEPLAAVYPRHCLSEVTQRLESGRLSLQELAQRGCDDGWLLPWTVPRVWVGAIANWNCPSDIE